MAAAFPVAGARRPLALISRLTALVVVVGMCAIVPADAASTDQPRRITQVKAAGLPGAAGTTVSVSVRIKNVTDKRKGSAHAKVYLVGSKRVFGLGSLKVSSVRAKGRVSATTKKKAPVAAPAGRYAVRVCLVGHPDHCRTSARTVEIAPPSLAASPTVLSFPDTRKGASSPAQQVRITNTGQSRTGVLGASVGSGSAFDVDGSACSTALAPGSSCAVAVRFTPRVGGPAADTLEVTDGQTRVSVALSGIRTEPATLSIAPGDVLFATTTIGESTGSQTITVTNDGDFTSGTPTVGLSGDDDQFDITASTCDTALPAGATCTLKVAYAPTTSGQAAALVTVSASPGGAVTANLTGAGQKPPALSISETSYDYGFSDAPAEHVFDVTNTGDVPTGVPSATIDGASAFSITSNTCTAVLAGGASCSVGVTYTGSGSATQSARLDVVATGGGTVSAELTGSPVALSIAPAFYDFGDTEINTTSDAESFVLTNHRRTSTLVDGESATGPFAVGSSCFGTTITAGGTCTFTASFSPTSAGAASGRVRYVSGRQGVQVDLAGRGTTPAKLTVTPGTADFGAWAVGGTPGTADVTVTNTGDASTQALSVALGGTDTDDFAVKSTTCSTALPSGGSCTVTVSFAPLSNGDKGATLTVSGAPGGSVALTGLGAPSGVSLLPDVYDFGSRAVGSSTTKTYRVVNTTEAGSGINFVRSQTPFSLDIQGDFTCVISVDVIQPHRWCTISIAFEPTTTGPFTRTMSAGGDFGTVSTTMNGTGVNPAARVAQRAAAGDGESGPTKVELVDGEPVVSR